MGYLVLARKWRPQKFSEVVGQEHIITTLQNALTQKRVAHSYLLTGPRGIGKTSTARVLAKALNCKEGVNPEPCNKCSFCQEITQGRNLDVLEIDGASNRGIDEIRNLRENIKFGTSGARYKVYIIDEVHMLTTEAFNALLKTLEEPPAHVRFVFATTSPERLPLTVLSRCQRFDFRRIPVSMIAQKLEDVAGKEGIKANKDVLYAIANSSSGSLRDAESILDQLATFTNQDITVQEVNNILGLVEEEVFFQMTELLLQRNITGVWELIDRLVNQGKDIRRFLEDYLYFYRNLLLIREGYDSPDLVHINPSSKRKLKDFAQLFTQSQILQLIDRLSEFRYRLKMSETPRRELEVCMVKLIRESDLPQMGLPPAAKPTHPLPASPDLDTPSGETGKGTSRQAGISIPNSTSHQGQQENLSASPSISPSSESKSAQPEDKQAQGVGTGLSKDKQEDRQLSKVPEDEAKGSEEVEEPETTTLDLDKLKKEWAEVVEKITEKSVSLGAILKNSRVVSLEDTKVNIGVPGVNGYSKNVLSKGKKFIGGLLEKRVKQKLKVDFSSLSSPSKKETSAKAVQGVGRAEDEGQAMIQKVIDIFDAKTVKIH